MSSSVFLIFPAVVIFAVSISGNVIPVTVDRWIPTNEQRAKHPPVQRDGVQSYSAYYQPLNKDVNNGFRNIQSGNSQTRSPERREQYQILDSQFSKLSQSEQRILPLPEPKPRNGDVFQEKLGFGMLSSLLPTSILNMPQENTNQMESTNSENNLIEADFYQNSPQSNSLPQFRFPGTNNQQSETYESEQEMTSSENSEDGLFSRIRNVLPFGKGFLSGFLNHENMEQEDNTGGISNLFGSQQDNNYGYAKSNSTNPFSLDPSQISLTNQESGSDNINDSESTDAQSSSGFLPSVPTLPNPITGLKNLLSSVTSPQDEDNSQSNNYGGGYADESNNLGSDESAGSQSGGGFLSSLPNPISGLKNLLGSVTSPQDENASQLDNSEGGYGYAEGPNNLGSDDSADSQSGGGFLSSLPNPFEGLRNLLGSITSPQDENASQSDNNEGGYADESSDPGDSSITALQSITDGGLGGTLGLLVPYLSHLISLFGIAKAKLPLVKLLGAVLGPIIAAAIAAMVIGIVYISIYISGTIMENANVDGEMYLLNLRQLLGILGIPDPLEELFDLRSLESRSMKSRSLQNQIPKNSNQSMLAVKTIIERDMCMERLACHAVGRKLMNKPSWKHGKLGSGIKWVAENFPEQTNGSSFNINFTKDSGFLLKFVRTGKSLIDAIALGMEPVDLNHDNSNLTTSKESACAKFSCDPLMFLKNVFISSRKTESLPNVNIIKTTPQ